MAVVVTDSGNRWLVEIEHGTSQLKYDSKDETSHSSRRFNPPPFESTHETFVVYASPNRLDGVFHRRRIHKHLLWPSGSRRNDSKTEQQKHLGPADHGGLLPRIRFSKQSRHDHLSRYPVTVAKIDHPIMKGFPSDYKSAMDELYIIEKVWPNTTVLATSKSEKSNDEHAVFWTNQYGKGRVFGTTYGHSKETFSDKVFLETLVNGIKWAAGR